MTTNHADHANPAPPKNLPLPLTPANTTNNNAKNIHNTNNIDLEYLINPSVYEKYKEQNSHVIKAQLNMDKSFYKKRIISTAKSILKDHDKNEYPEEVTTSFNNFIKNCIQYYKFIDTSDIIQTDYIEYGTQSNNQHDQHDEEAVSEETINAITAQLMKNKDLTKTMTMDDFVEKKYVETKKIILPQERNINIKENLHKKKRKKKKK
jgi:hypothetical protein